MVAFIAQLTICLPGTMVRTPGGFETKIKRCFFPNLKAISKIFFMFIPNLREKNPSNLTCASFFQMGLLCQPPTPRSLHDRLSLFSILAPPSFASSMIRFTVLPGKIPKTSLVLSSLGHQKIGTFFFSILRKIPWHQNHGSLIQPVFCNPKNNCVPCHSVQRFRFPAGGKSLGSGRPCRSPLAFVS